MNEDSRNDHGPVQSGAASASTGISAESPSRREFLVEKVGLGALVSATGLVAAAAAAQPVETRIATPLKPGITTLSGRRVVTLNVKLPNNVDLKTNIERVSGKMLALEDPDAGQDARTLVMDLTSTKAQDWLKPKRGSFSVSGTNCCCVRG